MASYAIEAVDLRKTFKTKKREGLLRSAEVTVEALRGVSFRVRYGEVVGLLGPNGAGKTTTIKILATLLLPDSGDAYIEGFHVVKEASEVRKRIGIMLTVERGFYGKLTGRENLEFFAALYGLDRETANKRVKWLAEVLELDKLGAMDKLFEEFSLGMRARLALARALLTDAPVLLLDEPTLGLDPLSARKIRELVKQLAKENGKAVLYTSHNMFEVELVCDRIIMLNRGLVIAEGTPEELKSLVPKLKTVRVVLRGDVSTVRGVLDDLGAKYSIDEAQHPGLVEVSVIAERAEDIVPRLVESYVRRGVEIVNMHVEEPSLEDVFVYLAQGAKT